MFRQNRKQMELIMQLRKDGRQPLTEISRKINMPVSTIFDRLKYNRDDIIKRFTCLLNFTLLGFNCRAQMVFKVRKEDRDAMKDYFMKHSNVNSVYKINNGYDFLVETVFKDLKEVDEFLERIDEKFKVKEKNVYYIIEDLARELFMTDKVHAELLGVI
ncbi:MAG: Lrp/AsnC family transcriptional regulator, partial [Candidatus Woesearchaeota archaeon]